MAKNLEIKIDTWKNKLLDMGKRNKLLNFKQSKHSTVRIDMPDMLSLWEILVGKEKTIEFPYVNDIDEDTENFQVGDIRTNLNVNELQKALRNLRDKSKTAMEEQGINALYLSFGILKWRESNNSDIYFNAPIILVPVTLTVESITSPYILKMHEDEIVVNPTLSYKLQNDFGITLPEFDEDEGLIAYFDAVKKLVAINKWEIIDETWISLLSFLKINMYNDLSRNKEKIINNINIRAIAGDTTASNRIPNEIIDFDFDKSLKPDEIFQVVDADSSQQDAVLSVKRGYSFVLQGPPGTGKSQTITNIISECLADGKKILFVSEKMAALDVVHRRLSASGLDDFCLVLHSHKANKKDVLAQLGAVLNLAKNKASISEEAYQKLDTLQEDKEKLNAYVTQLHQIVEPLHKSIYEVNGILANLESYDEVIFSLDNVKEVTASQYNRYNYLLDNLIKTIGKMTGDYTKNPWNGANVSSVSNELRHDVGAKLSILIPKIQKYSELADKMLRDMSLKQDVTYNHLFAIQEIFSIGKSSPLIPTNWIVGDEISPLFDEVTECENIKSDFAKQTNMLKSRYEELTVYFPLSDISELINSVKIQSEISHLKQLLEQDIIFTKLDTCVNLEKLLSLYELSKENANTFFDNQTKLLADFEKDILALDFKPILARYKTEYTNMFKVFKGDYKKDKKSIQALSKTVNFKVTDEIAIQILNRLKDMADAKDWFESECDQLKAMFDNQFTGYKTDFNLVDSKIKCFTNLKKSLDILSEMEQIANKSAEKEQLLILHYEFLYDGLNTAWGEIRNALTWAVNFREIVEKYHINADFINKICSEKEMSVKCSDNEIVILNMIKDINEEFVWFAGLFDEPIKIKDIKLLALADRLTKCQNGLFLLEEWIDFKAVKQSCRDEGLSDFIDKFELINIETEKVVPIFRKRFFRIWLDAILPDYPAISSFRRRTQESIISEFTTLDKVQFEIAKARIRGKLINELPSISGFTSGVDEISILKRELAKQRKIMPIRKLFHEIPNLLLKLKPCLMMSPLSVSLFLEADTYMFDVVIFDEASQVCTENAIGAIARGKQVIIAGDSKQLPPTNFFGASISNTDFDNDDDDEDDDYAYESLLDEANLLPERTLLWHYRSRHEHLIAFSNAKIYKSSLVTFPSNVDKVADNGVEYIYMEDGFYDRGGKKGNVIEAKKVAEMVFEHFKQYPNRSVGVVAFGTVQQQAIDVAIREMRMKNQKFESFFKEDVEEPFFVKNLENVQGDERDTIIFSIGYAKDINGALKMNFGPLSKSGGERRLNVAITRAKYNVKLVGSILPTDINIDKINADGPKLLRAYIDFAMNGVSVLNNVITESDVAEHDSPFEKSVYDFLDRKGYKLGTQVGCSGYRIDIAVKHPTLDGQFVLGIECDGASYHSARTARERDRLRQDVLENMGWKIYRIWSTDWIKDQVTEGERLITAVEEALTNYGRQENVEPLEAITDNSDVDMDNFVLVDEKVISDEEIINPYGFEENEKVSFSELPKNEEGNLSLADCIMEIVQKTYPVHYDLICKEMAPLFGNQKATVKIRREVDAVLNQLDGEIILKNDFYYPASYLKIPVYIPNTRKINHISIEELAEAMYEIASKCTGATKESLCTETTRAFGFHRMTANIEESMNSGFELLVEQGRFKVIDGKVAINSEDGMFS